MNAEHRAATENIFAAAGLGITETQFTALTYFADRLLDQGREYGVTGARDAAEIWRKHLIDSLLIFRAIDIPKGARLIDVGSGGGLPGLALKLYRPDLEVTLLDATKRRVEFVQGLAADLGIKGLTCLWGRAEAVGQQPGQREAYDLALSRAVAGLSVLVEYCLPLVKVGGYFVAYKGSAVMEEIDVAKVALERIGGAVGGVWRGHPPRRG